MSILRHIKPQLAALALFILILCLLSAAAQDSGTCIPWRFSPSDLYVEFPENNLLSGTVQTYTDEECTVDGDQWDAPADGWAYSDDATEQSGQAACDAVLSGSNTIIRQWDIFPSPFATINQRIWQCHNTPPAKTTRVGTKSTRPPSTPKPPVYTGEVLNQTTDLQLSAADGLRSGIQFQRVNEAGVGNSAVLEQGFLDAVDVWGEIGRGYRVCFPLIGRIIFIDTADMPRTPVWMQPFLINGYTCADNTRAGIVVLVKLPVVEVLDSTADDDTTQIVVPGTEDSIDDAIDLENCAVTPSVNLRLRVAPWGMVLAEIPGGSDVPSMARTKSWFNVTYEETEGWIAAWLATSEGNCDFSE